MYTRYSDVPTSIIGLEFVVFSRGGSVCVLIVVGFSRSEVIRTQGWAHTQ